MFNKNKPETLRNSMIGTVILQGTSAGLIFFGGLLLARLLGTVQFGAYDFADAWLEVLTIFAMMGYDRLVIRRLASYSATQEYGLMNGLIQFVRRRTVRMSIIMAVCASVLVLLPFQLFTVDPAFGGTSPIAQENRLAVIVYWLAMLMLPIRVMLKTNQVTLQGLQRVVQGYFPDYVLRPALLLVGVGVLALTQTLRVELAIITHILGAISALIVAEISLKALLPAEVESASPTINAQEWTQSAIPFLFISGMTLINLRGGSAILGAVTDFETLALYGIAIRLTAIIALLQSSVSAVVAPRIAVLHTAGELQRLQKLVTACARGITVVSLPLAIGLVAFNQQILGFFGEGYAGAQGALMILAIGMIFNTATGLHTWILMMTGYEKDVAIILTIAAISHLILLPILTPLWGVEGAALATMLTNVLANALLAIQTYRRLKINATIF